MRSNRERMRGRQLLLTESNKFYQQFTAEIFILLVLLGCVVCTILSKFTLINFLYTNFC